MLDLLLLPAAVAYCWAAARAENWPVRRTLLWCLGLGSIAVSLTGPLDGAADRDFAVHMVVHLVLGMVAPVLLVLAAPVTLALRVLPVSAARRLSALVKRLRWLTDPVVAGVLDAGGLWLLYATPLYRTTVDHEWVHLVVHVHVLVTGYLFTAAVIGVDPAPHRRSFRTRAVTVVLFLAAHDILAKVVYAHPPAGVATRQAQVGGEIMYYGGDLVELVVTAVLWHRWYAGFRHRTPAEHRADDHRGDDSTDDRGQSTVDGPSS